MSAWYVFGAIGFYPVCPSLPEYAVSGPVFEKVTIKLGSGKTFVLSAPGVSATNCYIQSASLNGEPFDKSMVSQMNIESGGTLLFEMGPEPNKQWGITN